MSAALDEVLRDWEAVIGLEVHTHLATDCKLFSPAPVRYGDPPNHDVHPIDLGLPGVLPVLNEHVIDLAIRLGLAIGGEVNQRSVFARKNFFYPDLPKGYQISQYEEPVVKGGHLEIDVPGTGRKRVDITRAHLEEDTGKSTHVGAGGPSRVDLNRCGVPLLEIVSEPDLRTPQEAGLYLRALRSVLRYTGVSDADMEKGQFRCDANTSLRRRGETALGTRTELKNLNSFRFVEAAIEGEILRQAGVLEGGGRIVQCTLSFDPDTGRTRVLRTKEDASDYRYFPDPDLVPLAIDAARIERVRGEMPELPDARRERVARELGLSADDARALCESRALADFFEAAVAAHGEARPIVNWTLREVRKALRERDAEIGDLALTPRMLALLVKLVDAGRLTPQSARTLFDELVESGGDPEALMAERGLETLQDTGLVEGAVDGVLAAHPDEVARGRAGDGKVLNFLMGQVMKRTRGKADPGQVRALLEERLRG